MSRIEDENRWLDERGQDEEAALSQVPAQCDCWADPPAVTPATLDEAGEHEDWCDYMNTQDGMYVSVDEAEQRESALREALERESRNARTAYKSGYEAGYGVAMMSRKAMEQLMPNAESEAPSETR